MTKEEINYTNVWMVNGCLVVAPTIVNAIEIFEKFYETPVNDIHKLVDRECRLDSRALINPILEMQEFDKLKGGKDESDL